MYYANSENCGSKSVVVRYVSYSGDVSQDDHRLLSIATIKVRADISFLNFSVSKSCFIERQVVRCVTLEYNA